MQGARLGIVLFALLSRAGSSAAAPARPAPALPPPSGTTVNVSTEVQLRDAVASLASNTTIVVAPGTYSLRDALYVNGTFTNIGIRGATGNSDDVVLAGLGMANASVPYGIWVGGNVRGMTIANLTLRDVFYHPIILNAGAQSPLVHNVHLINAGQQFVKSNPNPAGGGADNGIVEYSVIEYETTSRDAYTNGVDVHTGRNWIIRHNLFRNIRAPQGQLAGPAILMWNASSGTLAEGNTFVNCQREIAFGLIERTPDDHTGGIVRNNFIYRDKTIAKVKADAVLMDLDLRGVAASSGSACNALTGEPSHVLRAIGCDGAAAEGSLCFTAGRWTTAAEIDAVIEILPAVVARLRRLAP